MEPCVCYGLLLRTRNIEWKLFVKLGIQISKNGPDSYPKLYTADELHFMPTDAEVVIVAQKNVIEMES